MTEFFLYNFPMSRWTMALAYVSVGCLTCICAAHVSVGLICLYARRDLEKQSSPCLVKTHLDVYSCLIASKGSEPSEAK